jgi:uncharacterized protein
LQNADIVEGMGKNEMKISAALQQERKGYHWLAFALLLILLLPFPISGYVLHHLLHPVRKPLQVTPDQFQLSYQNVQFSSQKGDILLKGWFIPGKSEQQQMVILAHGYGENRSSIKAALPVAKALHERGIATLLFDFRNAGESGGDKTTIGMDEKDDLLAAIAFAKSNGYEEIGLLGFSMGAATSIVTAAASSDVKAIIADSSFSDLRPYLQENLPTWSGLPDFFTPYILTLANWSGMNAAKVRPIASIEKIRSIPLFLIHTKGDSSIPSSESVKLAKEYGGEVAANLWLAPGREHMGDYEANPKEYLSRVVAFFVKNLNEEIRPIE